MRRSPSPLLHPLMFLSKTRVTSPLYSGTIREAFLLLFIVYGNSGIVDIKWCKSNYLKKRGRIMRTLLL
jgi:hypothetical protein